jgi:hypothetical protein
MKRLVDESTDELTRSLLAAGIEHRPAPGNKAHVIVALGAGGAIGLFGSNAFAWLGTTAGKVTAAGVTVGIAGALFVVAPQLERRVEPHAAVHSGAGAGQAQPALEAALPAQQTPPAASTAEPRAARATASMSEGAALLEPASEGSASADSTSADSASADSASADSASADSASSAGIMASASDKAATRKLSSWRERRLAARRKAVHPRVAAATPAPSAPSAASQHEPAAASTPASAASSGLAAGGVDLLGAEKPDLDSEVRLVDDMHWAARRNDREALGRFLARYRETFADGQLKKEVAEFATRLEQSDISRAP